MGKPLASGRSRTAQILRFRLPEQIYQHVVLATTVFLVVLIGSGGWVRLSESGLGCDTWPNCFAHRLVAHNNYHSLTEFLNRCVIITVGVLVVASFVGALIRRGERRRDLTWLSAGLVAGYVGEAVLGGITVLLKLAPELVAAHFVLAMLVLADGVVLHWRAGDASPHHLTAAADAPKPVASSDLRWLSKMMLVVVGAVVVLGTVTTGSGPHAGNRVAERFHFEFRSTAELHAVVGMFLFGLAVGAFFLLRATGAPKRAQRTYVAMIGIVALQGVIGYIQYFSGVPVGWVETHIVMAALVLVALLRLDLELGPPRVSLHANPAPAESSRPRDAGRFGLLRRGAQGALTD